MIRNNITIVLLIFVVFACNSENTSLEKSFSNNNKTVNSQKSIFDSYSLYNSIDKKLNFIKQFKNLCSDKNHNSEYDLDHIDLENTRRDFFITFFENNRENIDHTSKEEKFYMGWVYDDEFESFRNDRGYILVINQLIINKTAEKVYYIAWSNERQQTELLNHQEESVDLDNTTVRVWSNLDKDIIRETFNFKGEINPFKLDNFIIRLNGDLNEYDIIETFRSYVDSSTYNLYIQE